MAKNVTARTAKKRSTNKQSKLSRKFNIFKELYSLVIACLTTVISLLFAKVVIPMVTTNLSPQGEVILLNQPHWEIGTTAFIEFVNPKITKQSDHYQFAIRPSHVEGFEISSFKNHKFSFDDDRSKNIESLNGDLKLMALLNVRKDYSSQTRSPTLFQINDLYKNEDGLYFKLYWSSPAEKEKLDKIITLIQDSPRAITSLMFDFIDTYSLMDKHVGLIIQNGHLKKNGDTITYQVQLDQKDGRFNEKDIILYGLGKQQINYILNENKDFKRENSILYLSDITQSTKPGAIIDILNSNHPEIILFGTNPPITGKIKNVAIDNDTLTIQFNNPSLSDYTVDSKLSANIILNLEITEHLSNNYVAPGEKTLMSASTPPEKKVILPPSQKNDTSGLTVNNTNNDIIFTIIGIEKIQHNDLKNNNSFVVDDHKIQYFSIINDMDSLVYDFNSTPSKPLKYNINEDFLTGYIILAEDGTPDIDCCLFLKSIHNEKNKVTFLLSDNNNSEEIMEGFANYLSLKSQNLILINYNNLDINYIFFMSTHNTYILKKDDEMYIDIILKRDDQAEYVSPKSKAVYGGIDGTYHYTFSNIEEDGYIRIRDKKELLNDEALSNMFDKINNYSPKAALIINDKTFLIRAKKVIVEDSFIRINFSLLEAKQELDIPESGRALILFSE